MQRAGRTGRYASLSAQALLFVEKSMIESSQKRKRHKADTLEAADFEVDEEELESEAKEHENELEEEREYKKKVEPALREWIETKGCRRDVADKYFNNPPNRHR